MSEQRFPGRIWITNPDTDFLRMQNLGPQHEWLHLTEHQHLMAEKDKRIKELEDTFLDCGPKDPEPEELTCFDCSERETCEFSGDDYNTNGDCLAEK